ncbi:MAG: hypothetical protein K5650_07745 [Bacteroidales bacterium]|nr:hypothetical protein [Bacteroidales bacterium]
MKPHLLIVLLMAIAFAAPAQDTLLMPYYAPAADTVYLTRTDTLYQTRTDTIYLTRTDTVVRTIVRTDTVVRHVADTAALNALREKEIFYKEILSANGVDKTKLEADRNHYRHLVDSLRYMVRLAELENVRKDEEAKYLRLRAEEAESKIAEAAVRKKKVRPIQGIAMRFYRTPRWEIRLDGREENGATTYTKVIRNRNAGAVEFDYVTGASVMLWDMTHLFNKNHAAPIHFGDTNHRVPEIRRFDQQFNYDLGLYVGFGGSNLFKNFYIGPSFRFVDFFYLTIGVNIAEYEVLVGNYASGDRIPANMSIDDLTAKAWLVKPFVSLSIDLDFISFIKK